MPKLQQGRLARPAAPSNPPGSLIGRRVEEARPVTVSVRDITPNPFQPRIIFDESDIRELADSISENGMLQRIGIAILEDTGATHIVYGERRWRATKLLERTTIEAIDYGERPAVWFIQQAYTENAKRKDFKLIERIRAYQTLLSQMQQETSGEKITQRMLAEKMGESESNVGKYLKIGEHPDLMAELEALGRSGEDGSLREFHAKAVAIEGTGRKTEEASQPAYQSASAGNLQQPAQSTNGYTSGNGSRYHDDSDAELSMAQHSTTPQNEPRGQGKTNLLHNSNVASGDNRSAALSSPGGLLIDGQYMSLEQLAEFGLKIEAALLRDGNRLKKEVAAYAARELVESMRRLYIAASGIFGEE